MDEAKAFVARIKHEFADASHNVSVYLVGHGATVIAHCTDDGEPSGTAGRPALAVLQGSGLGDVAVVVTRYFGGTKLGTGGLVRAYGDAVREVLAVLPRAEKVPTYTVLVAAPYPFFERVRLPIEAHRGQILDEDFGAEVTVRPAFRWSVSPPSRTPCRRCRTGRWRRWWSTPTRRRSCPSPPEGLTGRTRPLSGARYCLTISPSHCFACAVRGEGSGELGSGRDGAGQATVTL